MTIGTLTRRQKEVLDLLAEGMSTADIATKLWVSKATVRNHVQQILDTLGVHTRLAAVHAANVYVDSPGQRVIDLCRSQGSHLEPWQEVQNRRVFDKELAAPQVIPPPPAHVTISTTPHSQVQLPARDASAADHDCEQRRGHVAHRHRPSKPPPPLDPRLHGGCNVDKPTETTALLTFSCTGCIGNVEVKIDNDRPVNNVGATTGNRLINVERGEQTITVEITADNDRTLASLKSHDRTRSQHRHRDGAIRLDVRVQM